MILGLPDGVTDGRLMARPTRASTKTFRTLYEHLETKYFMPFAHSLHLSELYAVSKDERSMPMVDEILLQKMKESVLKKKNPMLDSKRAYSIGEYRATEMQKFKLELFLHITGRKPLIQPRATQSFSLFYISYCSAVLDPDNLTLWRDGSTNLSNILPKQDASTSTQSNYLTKAWELKQSEMLKLVELGLDIKVGSIYNKCAAILRESLNRDKYCHLKSKTDCRIRDYEKYLNSSTQAIKGHLESLAIECYHSYVGKKHSFPVKEIHQKNFLKIAQFALTFDPLCVLYTDDFFEGEKEVKAFFKDYQAFVAVSKEVEAKIDKIQAQANDRYVKAAKERVKRDVDKKRQSIGSTLAPLMKKGRFFGDDTIPKTLEKIPKREDAKLGKRTPLDDGNVGASTSNRRVQVGSGQTGGMMTDGKTGGE